MASQQEIQDNIDLIVTGANYPANSMRPLLTSMLDFSSAGQTLVFPDLVADNTTMANTTLVLDYGHQQQMIMHVNYQFQQQGKE